MAGLYTVILILAHLPLLIIRSVSLPLCRDFRSPINLTAPLTFCSYNETACCDSEKDQQLEKQFESMNISTPCSAFIKEILCARCDPFSAELFRVRIGMPLRSLPVLCNSPTSIESKDSDSSYCSAVWTACHNVVIVNSLFAGDRTEVLSNPTSSSLDKLWKSEKIFCESFGSVSEHRSAVCFAGETVFLEDSKAEPPPRGVCLEKISNGSFLNMVAHPDGSNRVFLGKQDGTMWFANVPEQDSGEAFNLDESNPFIDLTEEVDSDSTFGMMGMAFHPSFQQNGRFFVSFNCDKVQNPSCHGRCACNSEVDCDPAKLAVSQQQPCRYHAVIAEYTINGTAQDPSAARKAKPVEVRRIFTMGLPSNENHGGQILFGPADKYLYFMMGDGSIENDPNNLAQNKKSLLGTIMRIDVDRIPSAAEVEKLGLWGNYSIPEDNPYVEDPELEKEIWALGFRNPWRCSFDSERPNYFLCADDGEDRYEEVDIVSKGGNYGWNIYEGNMLVNTSRSISNSTELIFPVLGYYHSEVDKKGSAAIVGGYFYRSTTDPCLYGRYVYSDLYGSCMWTAVENPEDGGKFNARRVPFSCAPDSPVECSGIGRQELPSGYIYSFGEDNKKDVYILASSGVYRVVRPSRCNYTCSKQRSGPAPVFASARSGSNSGCPYNYKGASKFSLTIFSSILLYVAAACRCI